MLRKADFGCLDVDITQQKPLYPLYLSRFRLLKPNIAIMAAARPTSSAQLTRHWFSTGTSIFTFHAQLMDPRYDSFPPGEVGRIPHAGSETVRKNRMKLTCAIAWVWNVFMVMWITYVNHLCVVSAIYVVAYGTFWVWIICVWSTWGQHANCLCQSGDSHVNHVCSGAPHMGTNTRPHVQSCVILSSTCVEHVNHLF